MKKVCRSVATYHAPPWSWSGLHGGLADDRAGRPVFCQTHGARWVWATAGETAAHEELRGRTAEMIGSIKQAVRPTSRRW